jgi:hypothetical protein
MEGGKPENPEKNTRNKGENHQTTLLSYDEVNPGHSGERRALAVDGQDKT